MFRDFERTNVLGRSVIGNYVSFATNNAATDSLWRQRYIGPPPSSADIRIFRTEAVAVNNAIVFAHLTT